MTGVLVGGIWVLAIVGPFVAFSLRKRLLEAARSRDCWVILIVLTLPLDQFQFGGTWNIRIWNVLLLLAAVNVAFRVLNQGRVITGALAPVLCLWLFGSIFSFLNSPFLSDSVRQLVKILFVDALLYLIILDALTSIQSVERMFLAQIITSTIVAVYGIIQLVVWVHFGINWMTAAAYRPSAWFSESTWYGEYLVFSLAITLPYIVLRDSGRKGTWLWLPVALQIVGIYLSATRAAWIALAMVLVFGIMIARSVPSQWKRVAARRTIRSFAIMGVSGLLGIGASAIFLSVGTGVYIQERLVVEDLSFLGRVESTRLTLAAAVKHPIIGNGIGTWGRTFRGAFEGAVEMGGSHFNMFIGPFYDSGLFGLAFVILLVGLYLLTIRRATAIAKRERRYLRVAWSSYLSFIATVVMSQFHPWYLTGYAWLGIAVGIAAAHTIRRDLRLQAYAGNPGVNAG